MDFRKIFSWLIALYISFHSIALFADTASLDDLPKGLPTEGLVSDGGIGFSSDLMGTFEVDLIRENRIIHTVLGPLVWTLDESTGIVSLNTEWWGPLETSFEEGNVLGLMWPYLKSGFTGNIHLMWDAYGETQTPFVVHRQDENGLWVAQEQQSAIGVDLEAAEIYHLAGSNVFGQMQQQLAFMQGYSDELSNMQVYAGSTNIDEKYAQLSSTLSVINDLYGRFLWYRNRLFRAPIFVENNGGSAEAIATAQSWLDRLESELYEDAVAIFDAAVLVSQEAAGTFAVKQAERAALGGGDPGTTPTPWLTFSDITGNVSFKGGHGVMWADINNDGAPDVYYPLNHKYDVPNVADQLLINQGNGTFVEEGAARGVSDYDLGSHGAAWCDLDNDGDFDLINGSTYGSNNYNNVFMNTGDGFFQEITPAVIQNRREETRAFIAFDMDTDGDLDLFGVPRFKTDGEAPGIYNEVYLNQGNFNFTSVTSGDIYTAPACQGALDIDYDWDGDIDLIAANFTGQLNILNNDGHGNFTLVEPASIGIDNTHRGTDGITAADIDNDGHFDLLINRTQPNEAYLYRNTGYGQFQLVQHFTGTKGYMGGFADFDNDGDQDIYFSGDDKVYLNNGSGNYSAGPSVPVSGNKDPRGVAFADIDNDGDVDFSFGTKDENRDPMIRNNLEASPNRNWLKVILMEPEGQIGGFGAKVFIFDQDGNRIASREARSNGGYLAQDDPTLHFGLGSHEKVTVRVIFLFGELKLTIDNVEANQTVIMDGKNLVLRYP